MKGILCYDRFPPEDREAAQENINKLLGLYTEPDAIADPDSSEFNNMLPRPLSARYMPPLEEEVVEEDESEEPDVKNSFGGGGRKGGFGAGGGKKASKKKKKDSKKKTKARDGTRSDNPMFKRSGKTAYANRK